MTPGRIPVGSGVAAPGPAVVPARADGVELISESQGSGYRTPPALVRRADGQVVQLTQLLHLVLSAIDGQRTTGEIAAKVSTAYGKTVSEDNIETLVQTQLLPLGLLRRADGSQPETKKADPLLGLRFRYVVSKPEHTRRITAPFAVLFHPMVVLPILAAFAAVCWWVLVTKGLASGAHQAFYQPGLLLAVFALTILSGGFHEFGHAAAARYGGATPGVMGAGLYLIWPAFYTDVTDSYRLARAGRVRTDLGGLYFNAIIAVVTFGIWWVSGWDAWLILIATQILQMVRQLAPLLRFDGYHVLADVTGVPDLFARIKPTLSGLLPQNWRKPENQVLKPWARGVITTWVVIVVPLLIATLVLMVVTFPRLAGTAWDAIRLQYGELVAASAAGDGAAVAVEVLSIAAIALPVLGMAYILIRAVRQVATQVWRSTEARPGRRAVAGLLAVALLAGLGWLWWPQENRYRPIQPYERGALSDAVPAAMLPAGLREGRAARATVLWPASEPVPTAERPALSVVLVPRTEGPEVVPTGGATGAVDTPGTGPRAVPTGGATAAVDTPGTLQTWVFPFNRPAGPGQDDSQAIAVNTQDGGVVYDVAFALVWAEGEVNSANSAYALASCVECKTVAVAFQVVIVVGQSNAIAPENLAAAINYNCVSCVTLALAQQLVVTVDRPLTDEARAQVEALWSQIAAFGESLDGLAFADIRARLTSFEQQLLAIIERDQGLGQDPPSTTSALATEDESSDQSSTPGPQASDTSTQQPEASDTSTQQPEATATSSLGVDEPTDSASAQPEPSDLNATSGQESDEITTEPTEPQPEPSASDAEPTR
jgi:putative peptide zinc metalloprotease protein